MLRLENSLQEDQGLSHSQINLGGHSICLNSIFARCLGACEYDILHKD